MFNHVQQLRPRSPYNKPSSVPHGVLQPQHHCTHCHQMFSSLSLKLFMIICAMLCCCKSMQTLRLRTLPAITILLADQSEKQLVSHITLPLNYALPYCPGEVGPGFRTFRSWGDITSAGKKQHLYSLRSDI